MRTPRASRWQVFAKIRFPSAVPYIFAGLKPVRAVDVFTNAYSSRIKPPARP